jgi:hypothetical protein
MIPLIEKYSIVPLSTPGGDRAALSDKIVDKRDKGEYVYI